jgi:hypothetical protein
MYSEAIGGGARIGTSSTETKRMPTALIRKLKADS